MAGLVWVTDREPGVRLLFGELLPEAEVLSPEELTDRLALGQLPDALVIDGTQLLEIPPDHRGRLLTLPRLLICTGMPLASMPMNLISGPGVALLAKPFCVEDLEAALEWIGDGSTALHRDSAAFEALVRQRQSRGRLQTR